MMDAIYFILFFFLTGCATVRDNYTNRFQKPCTTTVAVTLGTRIWVNDYCRANGDGKLDDGTPYGRRRIAGCVLGGGRVIVSEDAHALWAEFEHIWARHCRSEEWKGSVVH